MSLYVAIIVDFNKENAEVFDILEEKKKDEFILCFKNLLVKKVVPEECSYFDIEDSDKDYGLRSPSTLCLDKMETEYDVYQLCKKDYTDIFDKDTFLDDFYLYVIKMEDKVYKYTRACICC